MRTNLPLYKMCEILSGKIKNTILIVWRKYFLIYRITKKFFQKTIKYSRSQDEMCPYDTILRCIWVLLSKLPTKWTPRIISLIFCKRWVTDCLKTSQILSLRFMDGGELCWVWFHNYSEMGTRSCGPLRSRVPAFLDFSYAPAFLFCVLMLLQFTHGF